MRMFNHSLHFIETKAVLLGRGFKPNFLVNKMSEIVVRSLFTPKHLPQYPQATTFYLFSIILEFER